MIKRVVSGYCWQYLKVANSEEERLICCRYKGPGELVGIASKLLGINEVIIDGRKGCVFEEVDSCVDIADIYLQQETRIALLHVRLADGSAPRNECKIYTRSERELEKIVRIAKSHNAITNQSMVARPLNNHYSILIPRKLTKSRSTDTDLRQNYEFSAKISRNTQLKSDILYEFALLLKSLLPDTTSLANINRVLGSCIGDFDNITKPEIISALRAFGLSGEILSSTDKKLYLNTKDIAIVEYLEVKLF